MNKRKSIQIFDIFILCLVSDTFKLETYNKMKSRLNDSIEFTLLKRNNYSLGQFGIGDGKAG